MRKQSSGFIILFSTFFILFIISILLYNNFFKKIDSEQIYTPQAEIGRISPPESIPSFTFLNENGKEININEFKGKVLLVNFWATWCMPCVKELTQFDKMIEIFGKDNIAIIPISIDSVGGITKLKEFYQKNKITNLPIYKDKNLTAYEAVMSFGIPTSIIVDRDLNAHVKVSGYLNWQDPEIMNILNSL
jgi:peroxiredoxin